MTKNQMAIYSDVKQLLPDGVELCLELNDPLKIGFKSRCSTKSEWSECLYVEADDKQKSHPYYLLHVRGLVERLAAMGRLKLKETL